MSIKSSLYESISKKMCSLFVIYILLFKNRLLSIKYIVQDNHITSKMKTLKNEL